eukprot:scaffold7296_cov69-Skeletonema_menzelii.AAC.1
MVAGIMGAPQQRRQPARPPHVEWEQKIASTTPAGVIGSLAVCRCDSAPDISCFLLHVGNTTQFLRGWDFLVLN